MSNYDDIIKTLAERRGKISARFDAGLGNSEQAIRQTIQALDHPASRYVDCSEEERNRVRQEWQELAAEQGVSLATPPQRKRMRKVRPLPDAVVEFFGDSNRIPYRPRATDDYKHGTRLCSWHVAYRLRSVQLNPPGMTHWLVFDCDHQNVERWRLADLPEPSFITLNPLNGHHHVVYLLSSPVCTSIHGRYKPIAYLRAVREALRAALDADENYTGLLTKNPLHLAWLVVKPAIMPAYTLEELAAGLDLERTQKPRSKCNDVSDLGHIEKGRRNRALFDAVRQWAYVNANDGDDIASFAHQCNELFPDPLSHNEVETTAKSIARFCSLHFSGPRPHTAEFRARQADRGRLGGRPLTTGTTRPWETEGISRATWYRRQGKDRSV
ncbi:MAG: hypothetical protein HHJ17_11805 [Rhodoferax sp.]|uniref:replication initiation protein n=1 Tax=Rhodoferax sp. TaxID=50421 RepID=UPI00184EEA14|nr:replication initiation protein [Rhodoferax sp.]NMM14204.1 hypothetical protein [Rhodoferax sp.]